MLTLDHKLLEDFMCDPRMSAAVLMGWEIDDFQAAALKMDWWFPWTIDSSGTGSGKTLRMFLHANLRAMLMEDHIVGAYFPTWGGTGQQEFWPYFEKTMKRSELYCKQLRIHRKKLGEVKGTSCWTMQFWNGSKIEMPAPNFLQDAKTQAGRSFNTLHVDEWLKVVEMGSGINSQLIERARRPSKNKEHPIWANHVHLKGHAQKPSHQGYDRVKGMRKLIKDGSIRHAMYSFCYKDFSPEWQFVVNDELIRTQKASVSRDEFARQILGLWQRDGATFYPEAVLARGARELMPMLDRSGPDGRSSEDDLFALGMDLAPGQSTKADWCAASVMRLRRVALTELPRLILPGTPKYFRVGDAIYELSIVWGWAGRNHSIRELAAMVHIWHALFRFSVIVADPGGGGQWLAKELLEPKIDYRGTTRTVIPICTRQEAVFYDKQPILHMFKRGGDLDELVGKEFTTGDDGFVAGWHMKYRRRWERGEIGFPSKRALALYGQEWSPGQLQAYRAIRAGIDQLTKVRQALNADGQPKVSKRGFSIFHSPTKKDIAYSGLYAGAGVELLLANMHGDAAAAGAGETNLGVW